MTLLLVMSILSCQFVMSSACILSMMHRRYKVRFIRGRDGRPIFDRAYNTATLLAMYYPANTDFDERITWEPDDPNIMQIRVPG